MNLNFFQFLATLRDHHRQERAIRQFESETIALPGFLALMALAATIAGLGLSQGNQAVIIGAMLITPLVGPIVGISLALATRHWELLRASLTRSILGSVTLFVVAYTMGKLFPPVMGQNLFFDVYNAPPGIPAVVLAFSAGAIASFAIASEKIHNRLSGAAIALSLAPPLAISAIDLGLGQTPIFINAFSVFLLNVFGLLFTGLVIFLLFGFHETRRREGDIG